MTKTLMRLVVQQMVFLELSADEVVNPDAAVREMDAIAGELGELSETDKALFIDFVSELRVEAVKNKRSEEYIEFLESIPEAFGLLD